MLIILARLIATVTIWAALPMIVVATNGFVTEINMVVMTTILALAAALSTRWIWTVEAAGAAVSDAAEKQKRMASSRVNRMFDSLTDEEMAELRARLMANDEVVPLETLLERDRRRG